jgi:hypothetical protein
VIPQKNKKEGEKERKIKRIKKMTKKKKQNEKLRNKNKTNFNDQRQGKDPSYYSLID